MQHLALYGLNKKLWLYVNNYLSTVFVPANPGIHGTCTRAAGHLITSQKLFHQGHIYITIILTFS